MSPHLFWGSAALALVACAASAGAQQAVPAASISPTASGSSAVTLPQIDVTASPVSPLEPAGISPAIEKFALPQTVESIDRRQIEATTNAVDVEDAIKYLPSLLLRKRNNGDTQPTLQTRTWGINSSARNLVYVDDIPISALISNNNTTGAPRWGLVSPEEIAGIDMLYGPFAAAYPGNSMGGVLLMTTRMPESFEATAKQTGALQSFGLYNTHGTYGTSNSAATLGDKQGRLSWFLSGNREDSYSQPLFFITNGSPPTGTTGTIPALSKTGTVADVIGAGGLLHSTMDNLTGKFALDVTDWLRATYEVGYWDNNTHSTVQSYLTSAAGTPTYGGVSGFANDNYNLFEQHLMNALSLKTDTKGKWDWEAVATRYDYLGDIQRNPAGVLAGETFKTNGFVARLDGTGWSTQDLKGIWRPTGIDGNHEVSFGAHRDQYTLNNPTYNADNWMTSPDDGNGTLFTEAKGKTETYALWAQDAWKFAPAFKLTLGGRLESWHAYDGFNLAGNLAANQPSERSTDFSPKATLGWQIDPAWSAKASFGEAYRYPTVAELYQIVATGATFAVPNPNLTPENVYSGELAVERQLGDSKIRLSLFQENTKNALISQTNLINNVFTTNFQNIDETRNRGIEFVTEQHNAFIPGLDLSNSITYVDSRIISDPTFQSATGTTATGKRVPYVPAWRDTVQVTYRPNDRLALSLAARYQSKIYSTLDNTDKISGVFGGFDKFFVVDAHMHYQISNVVSADAGVDNLFNEKYFEFHPFPGRTYVASVKVKF
ncbi:MAG TPA: TonB-dependent receptor [Stellaceae bacterium]|jgi:iron complex outermembrane receptor protein|nr:TonB-dependent receptor [Stellaceae bacterium]